MPKNKKAKDKISVIGNCVIKQGGTFDLELIEV